MRTIGLKPGDRVVVIERREGRELIHNALAVRIAMVPELAGARGELAIDAILVPPPEWNSDLLWVHLPHVVHVSHASWRGHTSSFAYEELPPQSGVCMFCGCTELRPCVDGNGDACRWLSPDETVCSSFGCLQKLGEEIHRLRELGVEVIEQ